MFFQWFENSRGSSCAVLLFSEETGCISLSGSDILTLSRCRAEVRHALLNSPAKLWQPPPNSSTRVTNRTSRVLTQNWKELCLPESTLRVQRKLYQKKKYSFRVFRQSFRTISSIVTHRKMKKKRKSFLDSFELETLSYFSIVLFCRFSRDFSN